MDIQVGDILTMKKKEYNSKVRKEGQKRVYYMCMEFLIGRSLKMNLNNLGIVTKGEPGRSLFRYYAYYYQPTQTLTIDNK